MTIIKRWGDLVRLVYDYEEWQLQFQGYDAEKEKDIWVSALVVKEPCLPFITNRSDDDMFAVRRIFMQCDRLVLTNEPYGFSVLDPQQYRQTEIVCHDCDGYSQYVEGDA